MKVADTSSTAARDATAIEQGKGPRRTSLRRARLRLQIPGSPALSSCWNYKFQRLQFTPVLLGIEFSFTLEGSSQVWLEILSNFGTGNLQTCTRTYTQGIWSCRVWGPYIPLYFIRWPTSNCTQRMGVKVSSTQPTTELEKAGHSGSLLHCWLSCR